MPFVISYKIADGSLRFSKYYLSTENKITVLRYRIDDSAIFVVMASLSYPFTLMVISASNGAIVKIYGTNTYVQANY